MTLVYYSWVWLEGGVGTLALRKLWLVISILWVITTCFTHLGKIPAFLHNNSTRFTLKLKFQWRTLALAIAALPS